MSRFKLLLSKLETTGLIGDFNVNESGRVGVEIKRLNAERGAVTCVKLGWSLRHEIVRSVSAVTQSTSFTLLGSTIGVSSEHEMIAALHAFLVWTHVRE